MHQGRNRDIIINHLLHYGSTFVVVGREEMRRGEVFQDEPEFPAEVDGVVGARVEALG